MRKRKFWGWGYEDELLSDEEENNIIKGSQVLLT